jgi:hypothetical protein
VISNHVQDNVSNVENVHLKAPKVANLEVDHPNFWGHKSLQKKWCSTIIYYLGSTVIYMQGFQATFHLQKYLVMEVNITPMPPCCVSFMLYLGGKNDSCNDKKNYGLICVT